MNEIDFVLLWVDGSDPAWRQEAAAARHCTVEDDSEIRYRDWRTLRYWFRSVERYAPWVRRIHFITWGHLPEWLDTTNPKLHIVNHRDYIPAEWLPTFNSNTIELNIHRIEGLAEHFVLFNDDTFLGRQSSPEAFFRNGQPCDMARLSIIQPAPIAHTILNNLELICARYRPREVIRRNPEKWFSPRYGAGNILKTISLLPWSVFPGLRDHHMPQGYRRMQFTRAWELWSDQLSDTCRRQLRDMGCLSHWLIRYDGLCRGDFSPIGYADCGLLTLDDRSMEAICRDIEAQRYRLFCINDSEQIADFEAQSQLLCDAFARLLPEKSSYER